MLERGGYMPQIAPGEQGLQVQLLNCPYGELATHHPVLCLMDAIALESLFQGDGARLSSIAKGARHCAFSVRPSAGTPPAPALLPPRRT
jgi:predicted ArsR family transcriptional regulator